MKDSQNVQLFHWYLCFAKDTLNQLWCVFWICWSLSWSGTDLVNESKKLLLVQTIQEIWARNMKMAVSDTDLKHEHTKETHLINHINNVQSNRRAVKSCERTLCLFSVSKLRPFITELPFNQCWSLFLFKRLMLAIVNCI